MEINKIYNESCLDTMAKMPDNFLDCVITSPPYYGLRDYGHPDQIGLEETPFAFVAKMVEVFEEVRRVLKPEGTLWLNLGDTYAAHKDCKSISQTLAKGTKAENAHVISKGLSRSRDSRMLKDNGFKNKDLIGIPWRVAFALQEAGWWLRQDIIWNKPNPMPESVTDRCTKAHEYIFLLTKSAKYYYDNEAIKEPLKDESIARAIRGVSDSHKNINGAPGQTPHTLSRPREHKGRDRSNGNRNGLGRSTLDHKNVQDKGQTPHSMHLSILTGASDAEYFARKNFDASQAGGGSGVSGHSGYFKENGEPLCGVMANKKSVWTVTTQPFKGAHFATFPEKLIVPCVLAGCPEGGIIYDPFSGAGTTALVAHKLGRRWIGSEISEEYCILANKRLEPYLAQGDLF